MTPAPSKIPLSACGGGPYIIIVSETRERGKERKDSEVRIMEFRRKPDRAGASGLTLMYLL